MRKVLAPFCFRVGEPTLAGLDFYRSFLQLEKKYSKPGRGIQNSIQTNGYLIDDAWAAFLHDNRFLTGLSLDGPAQIHDFNRTDRAGKGTLTAQCGLLVCWKAWRAL